MYIKTEHIGGIGFVFPNCNTLNEDSADRGKNHFLEHLMGKRLLEFRKNEAVAKGLTVRCITTPTDVRFSLSGLDKYVREASKRFFNDLFEDCRPFSEDVFENEKQVIENEYNMAFSQSAARCINNALRKHFAFWTPIGDKNVVRNYRYDEACEDIKRFAKPILSFAFGEDDFEENRFNEPFEKILAKCSYEDTMDPLEQSNHPNGQNTTLIWIPQVEFLDDKEAAAVEMLCTCLTGGISSPLYTEIRHKRGLAYQIGSGTLRWAGILPYFSISTNKPAESKAIFEEIVIDGAENIEKYISREWFETIRSSCVVAAEVAEIFPHKNIEQLLRRSMGYTATLGHHSSVTYEEVLDAAVRLKKRGYFFRQEC